jgi:shikimate dehydrogenase
MNGAPARLAGVIGWPIAHSLSPRLHAHWLREYRIHGFYLPLAVRREDFGEVCRALAKSGFAGVNVTVPHKEAALALAHEADAPAQQAGTANLLLFAGNGHVEARNTDSHGLVSSLEESLGKDALRGASVALLGAGGAARAAIFALETLGADTIMILSRNRERADAMASALQPRINARLCVLADAAGLEAAGQIRVLINATSGGMRGAAPLVFSLEALPRDAAVCDLVYNPIETELLKDARRRGHRTIDGLGMLIHQAVPAFEAFFGTRPKISEGLRQSLVEALGG